MADMMSNLKIITVGNGTVGKTSLLMTFVTNEFPSEYVPTVYDHYTFNMLDAAGKMRTLCLLDTAGREDYDHLRPLRYRDTGCVVICFCIDNRKSYEDVQTKWCPELDRHLPGVPIVLVGTKSDTRVPNSPRFVTTSEGMMLKRAIGAHAYVECSALKRDNLREVFHQVLKAINRKGCCQYL